MNAPVKKVDTVELFPQPICEEIWNNKYRYKQPEIIDENGEVIPEKIHDLTVHDTWNRVAESLAIVEKIELRSKVAKQFNEILSNFLFLPGGRILAGAGTAREVTLFNCFVMGTIPDNLDGIFDAQKQGAKTMQKGGGIGNNFSTLRPKNSLVKSTGSEASGPVSFMFLWDAACNTIKSVSHRRGAMMGTMICSHPDIELFIDAKREKGALENFNLSVLVTDPFMEAVIADEDWDLVWNGKVYKTVRARYLWDKIMDANYNHAEPGVIFIDAVNRRNNLAYCETIAATNPCGEQPLPPFGACLLGSLNLARFIRNPFCSNAHLDVKKMKKIVASAIRMLDNVIDISKFPLPEQEKEAKAKRRIGLGITGLGDALAMSRIIYGSDKAITKVDAWMREIQHAAYWASVELAKEKGPFPLFDAEQYLKSPTIQELDQDLQDAIRKYGIRNSHLTSIAPTGTISLYAGNVSSGIEPIFAFSYTRKITQKDGSKTEQEVVDFAVDLYRKKFGIEADLPDYFVTSQTITPADHIRTQAAAQKWVDSAISKTINVPKSIPFEDFKDVYMDLYKSGCKGGTVYRPNDNIEAILSVNDNAPVEADPALVKTIDPYTSEQTPTSNDVEAIPPTFKLAPLDREPVLEGKTYKIKWPNLAHAFYITINNIVDPDNGNLIPFEVFINTKNVEAEAWITALTRMISAVFRRGGDVAFVAKELQEVYDPTGGSFFEGKYQNSLVAAIGSKINQHLKSIGYMPNPSNKTIIEHHQDLTREDKNIVEAITFEEVPVTNAPLGSVCPKCGERSYIKENGCGKCVSCGHSTCG